MPLTTQWSRIEQLQGNAATDAWQWFMERYRDFVKAALRRLIWSPERAESAAEEFWAYLYQDNTVARLHRQVRFRRFLVGMLRNYAHVWMRENPRQSALECDELCDQTAAALPEDEEIALWSRQILVLALKRLDREHARQARVLREFYGLPVILEGQAAGPRPATAIAADQDLSSNALHQLLFRARARLRECVIEEIRQTVSTRGDLDTELAVLVTALSKAAPGIVETPGSLEIT